MSTSQFVTLIRLPFSRASYVDPPQAEWDTAKDRALWKVISKSSKTSDLNWAELATRFEVPPAFLLQQAAWLYERHLDHVRTQMKKVGTTNTSAKFNSNASQSTAFGGIAMRRTASGGHGRGSKSPSGDCLIPKGEASVSSAASPLSRTPSTATITQSRAYTQQVRAGVSRPAQAFGNHKPSGQIMYSPSPLVDDSSRSHSMDSPGVSGSSSSDSSLSVSGRDHLAQRSQLFKKPPRFRRELSRESSDYEEASHEEWETEDPHGVTLPFAQTSGAANKEDKSRTKPAHVIRQQVYSTPFKNNEENLQIQHRPDPTRKFNTHSSVANTIGDAPRGGAPSSPNTLSPRHRPDLAKISPQKVGQKTKKDGSEGTPSMGSSFSDIDDAGISQSALEEALLSNIQHGRMSTLSQLRSRYL